MRYLTTALLLLAGILLPAGAARAAVPITSVYAGPITAASDCEPDGSGAVPVTQAGGRPDFCVAFALSSPPPPGDDLQRQVVDTPLGFAGDPTGRPVCTTAQFAPTTTADVTCDPASQVGTASTDLRLQVTPTAVLPLFGVSGRAYVITPQPDELARVGIVLDPPNNPKVKIQISITLRPQPEVGLRSTIDNLPKQVCLNFPTARCDYAIALDRFALRFWGSPADHPTMPAPFALVGTDCAADQVTTIRATSYDGTPTEGSSRYRLTDCATAPFAPSLAVSTTEQRPDVPTEATVSARFSAGAGGRVASPPRRTVVTLPSGVTLSAQIASGAAGLPVCSADAFGFTTVAAAACPAASAVGTVQITSPLLDAPLTGRAFVGAQREAGALPDLYVEAALGGDPNAPRVKLIGTLAVDDAGRLVATLDDLPQLPTTEVTLTFRGGDQAALVTPPTCRESEATIVATPASGAAAITATSPYAIAQDCGAVGGFAPGIGFSSADPQAGGRAPFTTTITRPDRTQRLARTVIDLPPGQVADLKGVPECAQDVAARGACDPATRVGSVRALAGVGPAPTAITGSVFLTARSPGAVAGISIHVPVVLGEVNLGNLDVPARIEIRPEDLGLRIVADVPERFKGLPLDLRQLDVTLDRPGFPLNPTSCDQLSSTSQFTAFGGATASVAAGYRMQGCDRIAFAPALLAAVTGDTKNGGRPAVNVRIDSPAGTSALRRAAVTLPDGLSVDLKQLPRACPIDTFRAGACPDTSRIGRVSGSLAITDEPLGGSIYLLKPAPGTVLPGLGLDFVGRFAGRVVGSNAIDTKTGRIISRFDPIPDLPLTSLQVEIAGGNDGLLIATGALCTQPVRFDGRLDGQNGGAVSRDATSVCGAPLGTRITTITGRMTGLRKGKPVLRLNGRGDADRRVARIDLTLPSGWSLGSQRGKRPSRYASVSKLSVKGSAKVLRRSPRRLRLTMPKAGSSKFSLITRTGTISVRSSAARRTKVAVLITARITYRDGGTITVPLLLRPR